MVKQVEAKKPGTKKLSRKMLDVGRVLGHLARKDKDFVEQWKEECKRQGIKPSDALQALILKENKRKKPVKLPVPSQAEQMDKMNNAAATMQLANAVCDMATNMTQVILKNEEAHLKQVTALTDYIKKEKLEEGKAYMQMIATKKKELAALAAKVKK